MPKSALSRGLKTVMMNITLSSAHDDDDDDDWDDDWDDDDHHDDDDNVVHQSLRGCFGHWLYSLFTSHSSSFTI